MTPAETANYLINTTVDMAHAVEDAAWLDILEDRITEVLTQSRKRELEAETRACAAEERAARAEEACAVMRAALEDIEEDVQQMPGYHKGPDQPISTGIYWVAHYALRSDAGLNLLTAVQRLVEIWSRRDSQDQEWWSDMNEALADPALKIAHSEPK